jgi:hypothetical protein
MSLFRRSVTLWSWAKTRGTGGGTFCCLGRKDVVECLPGLFRRFRTNQGNRRRDSFTWLAHKDVIEDLPSNPSFHLNCYSPDGTSGAGLSAPSAGLTPLRSAVRRDGAVAVCGPR